MKLKLQKNREQGPKVPAYIVTFSDMVTLLLTFFVLLISLADVQDPELFDKGRDSFVESLRYIGLGMLFGREQMPDFGESKTKDYVPEPEEEINTRNIDAKAEQLHQILQEIQQSVDVVPAKIAGNDVIFSTTNIHFETGQSGLNEQAIKFLSDFCSDLQLSINNTQGILYVLGLATDIQTERLQWIVSAQRAANVAEFLRGQLVSSGGKEYESGLTFTESLSDWSVYSWGAGAGGDWTGPDSTISDSSQIFIAVLNSNG